MNLPGHQLPRERLIALASGVGGNDMIHELVAAEYSKHVVLLRGVLMAAEGSEQYPLARLGYDLLSSAWRANRAAAERVIRHPSVGVWAQRTIQARRGGPAMPGTEPGGLRAVGAAAAIHARLRAEIEVTAIAGQVMLPSLGAAMVPGPAAVVRSGDGGAEVGRVKVPGYPYQDAPGWLGLHRFRANSLCVLIDDLDPFRMPDQRDLALRLPTRPWDTALRQAWSVLEQSHPVVTAELAAAVSVIVPCSRRPTGAVSATSPEAFGTIAMSLPTDPIAGAETLVHELQHLKLGALLDLVALAHPDDGRRYYAPWRDDPRPLDGLLQGSYAFFGVTRFWRDQRQLADGQWRADVAYARWRAATMLAVETLLSSGRLTSAGLDFVSGMARTLRPWQDEPLPTEAQAEARRAAELHQARWQAAHGRIPPGGAPYCTV
jgi:HEXXH motif-containing protein